MDNFKKFFYYLRHIIGFSILVFFIASFFIGVKIDPSFVDIARSPYGMFTYVIITSLTIFVPSMVTLPVVTTATIIWGPWVAGSVAIAGWTIGGIVEYYAAVFSLDTVKQFVDGPELEKKLKRVRESINFWQLSFLRLFVPCFIFGMAKTRMDHFIYSSIIAYVPLAAVGVGSGALLKPYFNDIQPLLLGGAFVVLIFTLDYYFVRKQAPTN